MNLEAPFVSVVIPVFNQGRELEQCLVALQEQTYPSHRFEVIVVDNGSDEPVDSVTDRLSFVRVIQEPTPGSYAARNSGIGASRGEVIAFTDADCVPAAQWIEQGVLAIQRLARDGLVAGRIVVTVRDGDRPTTVELYESVFALPQKMFLTWRFGATANLFTTRATVERVGSFNERLMSGGDMEWGQRLADLGLAQDYSPDACVSHPARRTVRELWKRSLRVAGGLQQVAEERGLGTRGLVTHAIRQLICLQQIRAHLSDHTLDSLYQTLKVATAAWLVELVRVCERYRVHWGGRPFRN